MFLEVQTILYNGEGVDNRTGLYNFRAKWYSASNRGHMRGDTPLFNSAILLAFGYPKKWCVPRIWLTHNSSGEVMEAP